jgi:transcriptional antiterminator NusG
MPENPSLPPHWQGDWLYAPAAQEALERRRQEAAAERRRQEAAAERGRPQAPPTRSFRWYAISTYSGHENKVKDNLEHRIDSMNQAGSFRRVFVPYEPGYLLVNMDLNDEAWSVVKSTPGVTGFVGAGLKPVPLPQGEVDRILYAGTASAERPRVTVEFSPGERVKVASGPLSDFDGEIVDVNRDQQLLKVLVNIFERQVEIEVGFDQVKKLD